MRFLIGKELRESRVETVCVRACVYFEKGKYETPLSSLSAKAHEHSSYETLKAISTVGLWTPMQILRIMCNSKS